MPRALAFVGVCAAIACGCGAGSERSFSSVQEAVSFIVGCLENDDYNALCAACVGREGRPSSFSQNRGVFINLKGLHARVPLSQLYAGATFPGDGDTFKLGGHGKELGHIHIDFVRTSGGWKLADIWGCR